MSYYYSQEWMEETDQIPPRDEILEYNRSQILDEVENYTLQINNKNYIEKEINKTFYHLYINYLDYIDEDDVIYMQEVFVDIIFNIVYNNYLTQDTIIQILEKYISHGFIIEKFVDNADDKTNIIILFANNQRYKVIDYLLSKYSYKFECIKYKKNCDDISINSIIQNLKIDAKNILNQNFFKQNNQDVLQIIIKQSYNYFKN